MILVAAWERLNVEPRSLPIYHCCSSTSKVPFLRSDWPKYDNVMTDHPYRKAIGVPNTTFTKHAFLFQIGDFCFHYLPAVAVDWSSTVFTGKSKKAVKSYQRMVKLREVLLDFTQKHWFFETNEMKRLSKTVDSENFYLDLGLKNESQFYTDCWFGIRKYLLKDDGSEEKEAKQRMNLLIGVQYGLNSLLLIVIIALIWYFAF